MTDFKKILTPAVNRERCGYPVLHSLGPETDLAIDERGEKIVVKRLNESCLLQGRLHPAIFERLQRIRELPLCSVANFHGVQRDGEDSFLIWSFVEGKSLAAYVTDPSTINRHEIALAVRSEVEALHAAGIVHGAMHEHNVIIDERNQPHLTHISPLLFHDPAIDLAALDRLSSETIGVEGDAAVDLRSREPLDRSRMTKIAAALGVALVGGATAFAFYWRQR